MTPTLLTLAALMLDPVIPHAQDRPPNKPYSAAEAVRRMTVPEGFAVEVVAAEPNLVNPVAMTFDERGRAWITESLEYPRREPGKGRDRIKVLEDTDGDGVADKFTVFAEGLNIPSGIAVGYGGVWVANAPDILFLQDTDGDGVADRTEVVVTGFGRSDTHELPNSLTWGPDGWLYGWNGVFNPAHIQHRGQEFQFTCAIFRIHPRTREFEVFCEGVSNPWGIAWNEDGEAFASACVIDHLWHLTETGYYRRQGGPYPPFTWFSESIVDHNHQKAAYCGIHYFDSDAYPEKFRGRLYMGNIHGGGINVDTLKRDGSTYRGESAPDFLAANDAWFMPVVQKTGPDGSLYVLDWYDRYHCYQDANRDPAGIDRLKGRLYRVRYRDTPRAPKFDLANESDIQLIERLRSPNVFFRDTAQRLLTERGNPKTLASLRSLVLDPGVPRKARMHGLWVLVSAGPLDAAFHKALLAHDDHAFRAWGVRAAGNRKAVEPSIRDAVVKLAADSDPAVPLQVAIACNKLEGVDAVPVLVEVLSRCGDDVLIPHIVWRNLHPLLETRADRFVAAVEKVDGKVSPALRAILPRAVERILARKGGDPAPVASLLALLVSEPDPTAAGICLERLAARVQTGEIAGGPLEALREKLQLSVRTLLAAGPDGPLYADAALLATSWKDPAGFQAVRKALANAKVPDAKRLQALDALIAAGDDSALATVAPTLADRAAGSLDFRGKALGSLGRLDDPKVADVVLSIYPRMEPELRPRAVELLTQRPEWSRRVLKAIARKDLSPDALNVNQVRKLLANKDPELVKDVRAIWGTVREGRNPDREQVVARMRTHLRKHPGDATAGTKVFQKLCAQCHKIYGEGQEVGPDLTGVGRGSFEGLLSNVFDPNLVIGASYQATTVATADGRVLTGLLAEDSPQKVVLKIQGGKQEVIPRADVEEMKISEISLMPEDLEKQLTPEEWSHLFAFLTLDKPPGDPSARPIPGAREPEPRETRNPAEFNAILADFAPGFTATAIGGPDLDDGMGIVKEHLGRSSVLRTHPVSRDKPCVLRGTVAVPASKAPKLVLDVAHDPRGDWRLLVKADGKTLHDAIIGPMTTRNGWAEVRVDLAKFAGKTVDLELINAANDWAWEFGYWGRIEVVAD